LNLCAEIFQTVGISIFSRDGVCLEVNRGVERLTGFD
jgi:PAS domain-containing protein